MILRLLHTPARRRGFTLVELLITISIIGIMASMVMFAMFSAQEAAREQKTRALITKLNNIVMQRYESYRTRRVPFTFPTISPAVPVSPIDKQNRLIYDKEIAKARIDCLRDLMRMEMPDRWSDVTDIPAAPFPILDNTFPAYGIVDYGGRTLKRPSVNEAYYARATAPGSTPSVQYEGAECLYMIVMQTLAQEGDSRDVFKAGDIGDLDDDNFPEFLDAWRSPIHFLRWVPGFQSTLQNPVRGFVGTTAGLGSGQLVTVSSEVGRRFTNTPGSYVGGTIIFVDKDSKQLNSDKMARITGYTYDATNVAHFTCETLTSKTGQPAFQSRQSQADTSSSIAVGDEFVICAPDPFDSRGTYPTYISGASRPDPDTSTPTFALYPLIFSEGKDKVSGIATGGAALQYSLSLPNPGKPALNPFFVLPADSYSFGLMVGGVPAAAGATEQGFYQGCEVDNITNHDLNRR
jgi:prepilin-type N-terminal cleavage/methylation domain-containing protein